MCVCVIFCIIVATCKIVLAAAVYINNNMVVELVAVILITQLLAGSSIFIYNDVHYARRKVALIPSSIFM